jgi:acyl-CoA reductase-like NAD-dependent aldehyde dehydrogenase
MNESRKLGASSDTSVKVINSGPRGERGPLIDITAVEKVEAHIADALKKGAKVVTGGKRAAQGGTFFEPTVLTDVTTDMVITKEETFGPVAPLYRFKTDAGVIEMANDTEFGLASYFYSRDIGRIWRVAEFLEYGIVGINEGIISTEIAPFAGMKESGIGPIWRLTGARNTASRNSSKSNTSAWAASTAETRCSSLGDEGSQEPSSPTRSHYGYAIRDERACGLRNMRQLPFAASTPALATWPS